MATMKSIETLASDLKKARSEIDRLGGQKESHEAKLAELEMELRELGFSPDEITEARLEMINDVNEAASAVQEELLALEQATHAS